MSLEDLKLEKDIINDLQGEHFSKLVNEIKLLEEEICCYKSKVDESENIINQLILELKLLNKEIIDNKIKNKELEIQLDKEKSKIHNSTVSNTYNEIDKINTLKDAFIESDDSKVENILDEILEKINIIENILSEEDAIFLMYVSYIYDRLKVILNNSTVVNSYYLDTNKESELLKIVSEEESCKINSEMNECTQSYISREKELFIKLDEKLKKRIIETLYDMSYMFFEEVYSDNEIDKDDNIINIKCWIRDKKTLKCNLVSTKYSDKKRKIYMANNKITTINKQDIIKKEDVIKNSFLIDEYFEEIKSIFLNESPSSFKKLMRANSNNNGRIVFNNIVNLNITKETVSLNKAYTLLLISILYNKYESLLSSSEYLRKLANIKCVEIKLIKKLKKEIMVKAGDIVDLPLRVFINKNKDNIKYIDIEVKNKLIKIVNSIFYGECTKVLNCEYCIKVCSYDGFNLKANTMYIKLSNRNVYKYMLYKGDICCKCNTMYIQRTIIRKIESNLKGLKVILNPQITDKKNESKDKVVILHNDKNTSKKILYSIKQAKVYKEEKRKPLNIGQSEVYNNTLNKESDIKKMGYNTSLSREERWNILKNKAITRLGKAKVINHISFLVNMNKDRKVMANAVSEWRYDLERLKRL